MYKDFPPGWNHILVPTASRAAAKVGLAMYTPCRWRGELTQNAAWAAVSSVGPALLPGRSVEWQPPEPLARWQRLMRRIGKTVGSFDHHVVYERREGRPGVLLVLISGDAPLAFVKIRLEEDESIDREARALELVASTDHASFAAPQLMTSGVVEGWSYLVTSPLPAGRHRMLRGELPDSLFAEITSTLRGISKDKDTPDHWMPMHGDCTPWNLRTFGRGPWLIDWETAAWGPPHADEVLYRATAAALGRRVPGTGPNDVAEAVHYWIDTIEQRAATRAEDGLPAEEIDTDTIEALRTLGGPTTVGRP